jgi:inhibitor of KinA
MYFNPLGDRAVTITLGSTIDEATHRLVRAAASRIAERRIHGLVDLVPAFASITVHYEPADVIAGAYDALPYDRIVAELEASLANLSTVDGSPPRLVEIPVCYGGELGPDLADVARLHDLSTDEVVRLHAAGDYLVYMIGFMPGFAYLGGLSQRIATPRRQSPRTAVPAGAVGIGGEQTGVYPMVSPGGWNLIGRTPLRIFDVAREEPALLATGDRVRFAPISREEFDRWTP